MCDNCKDLRTEISLSRRREEAQRQEAAGGWEWKILLVFASLAVFGVAELILTALGFWCLIKH